MHGTLLCFMYANCYIDLAWINNVKYLPFILLLIFNVFQLS